MASHAKTKVSHGFIGDNPGWVATLFAIAITAGFLGLIYNSATSHHPAPGAPAHGAPAGSAPAAHH